MFKRKKSREVPGLNTTATADISFMLLIFFLVTTSIDSDKGLGRQLPPPDPDKQERQEVARNKVLTIQLLQDDKIKIDDKAVDITPAIRTDVKNFVSKTGPEHIIDLQVSPNATYDAYFRLQNQLVIAYRELGDKYQQRIKESTLKN